MLIVDANKKRSRELPAYRLYYNDNTPTTTNLERICVFLLKRLQFLLQLFLRDNHFVDHHFALSKHVIATTSSAGSDRAPLLLLALMLGRCMCLFRRVALNGGLAPDSIVNTTWFQFMRKAIGCCLEQLSFGENWCCRDDRDVAWIHG